MLVQIKCMIYLFIVIVQISLLTPQRKRYMGQGGGCLGPVKNKDQIYVKLITEMHAQAQKITNTQNLDLYTAIKQKITKKGYLRKFIDNLSCHRQKILDSLNFNFKSTTQKKQIERHYAGLIIADAIIEMVYSPTTFSEISAKDDMSEYDENNMSFFKKNAFKMKQISSDVPEYKLEMLEQYKIVYDEQYFKLITFLFDIQKKMYARLLDSLIAFCTRHTGQINCESYVWKTIEKMNNNIKKRTFLAQSCQLFYLLLIRTKDQLTQQLRNQQNLISIIKTWLKQRENEEQEGIQIQDYCKQIIQTYFHRCLSSWDSLFIYESIFSIYDSIQFQVIQRQPLEKMYEQILKHSDFEKNFYRGLFNYFLGYMSITNQNYVDELDRKWFSTTLGLSYQKIRSNYKSLLKEKVKIQCFKLLPKWIQKHYVDINEYCMYNSKALIFVYLENSKHFNRNKGSTIMIMDEYFKVIKKMQLGYRRLFMQRLFQQIREQGLTSIQYQLLLKLIQQMVYNNILTENPPTNEADQSPDGSNSIKLEAISEQQQLDLYLTPILPKYSQQVKLELIKLLGYVAQSSKEFRLNEEGRVKLCQFLYSIYDNIVYGNSRKMNPKVRNKESFVQNNDKNKVNRSSGNNGLSINSEQLYTKYEFICSVISLFRIFIVQQQILSSEQRMKTSQQAPQKLQNQQTQLIPTSSSNTNQNHSQHEQESRQKESQAKQYTNIQNVLKIYVQKIQEQMQTLSQKYSRILEPDIQIKQSRQESNFNISSNSFKFSAEIEYLLIYLLEQIKAMLTPSNKQIQTEKYTKNEVLVKMTAINNKLKPTINREEHLEQIMREIKDFLEQYRQKDNLFIIVEKEIEQQEQFRSILGRYFSISNPITDPYKQFLSRPTLAQKLSRTDSDNMSTYTKQSSKYGGLVNQNARCQKCKNLPQKCVDCRDKDRRSFRHSDYSFMEVIDIVKV